MKQNIFFRVIVAIAMMLIGWLPSLAHDFEVDGVFYNETSDNTAAVTYKGYSYDSYLNEYAGDVVIPSSVNYYGVTYSVTSIGYGAFVFCESLASIQIPNSVTSIGDGAFAYCTSLTGIEIPNSVTSIGDDAFAYCYDLTSIQIPNSVTSIGDGAFAYCYDLTSIQIPNSVTGIGNSAFHDCSSLTSIEIPNSVTSVGDGAFEGCKSLTSIEIPNSVTSIGEYAFSDCESLTSIEIPNSVTSIGEYAFSDCESLTSVVWNAKKCSDFSSSSRPFENSPNITSFTLGDEVEHIPAYLCYNLSSLTSIQIPNSVTSIGGSAFEGCKSLTSIEIPNSVTGIGNSAFHDCSSLTSIEIPNSVTSVGDGAFWNCTSLTSVVWNAKKCSDFSSSSRPFENSPNITSFTFGDEVEHIPAYLCYNLSSLTSIQIPNSVTGIGNSAFEGCKSLTSIEIPNSVTSIGEYAFYNCESLTSVIWNSVRCSDFYLIYTPFENCPNITSFTFGDEVEHIPAYLCYNLSKLTSIQIPNSVTSIGYYAFRYCSGLTSVEIGNSVTSIGDYAFWECSSLTSIVVDAGNTKYDSRNGCNAIIETASSTLIVGCQNTIIPNSVTSIGEGAFGGCDSLRSIVIPNSVTSIGEGAFYKCSRLTSIEIPNSVTWIGDEAFYDCTSLTKITCWATTPPAIYSNTFSNYDADLYVPAGCISAYQSANHWKKFYNIKEIPTLSTSIALNKTSASLKVTETLTLVATVLPELTTNKSLTWTSSNEAVATVDVNGVVTAIALGEATITATTTDGTNLSATCKVTVVPTLVVSIEVTPNSVEAEENSEVQLSVNILPENATYKSVEWSSSNDAIASVNANGLVKIRKEGNVVITATTTDGSNLSATCSINVYSGINGVNGNDVIVATIGDNIVVKNAQLGSNVRVYAADGAMIASEVATEGDVIIEAPVKGVYVVKVGKQTVKVII